LQKTIGAIGSSSSSRGGGGGGGGGMLGVEVHKLNHSLVLLRKLDGLWHVITFLRFFSHLFLFSPPAAAVRERCFA